MSTDERYWVEGMVPETPQPDDAPFAWPRTTVVGTAQPRVDGYERVSGSAVYPSDVVLPGMLYGAMLRCPHANARLLRLDTSRAESMPGVRAVIHAGTPGADLPWSWRGAASSLFPAHCCYEGEPVAAVAAEDPYQARDALAAIEAEWQVLPFVSDELEALAGDAPPVHDGGNRVSEPQVYERGDVAAGFAAADVVLESDFRCRCEMQSPLELHGCVARWDGDRLTVWESTQGVYAVHELLTSTLGLPSSKVRVIGHYMGGGFGSKLQGGKYTLAAALLARHSARPVKLFLSREEALLATGNRPPSTIHLKAGVTRDGALTALEMSGVGASGAWPAGGTSLLDWLVRDLYRCPNVRTETSDVYLNAGPARPFRAPGHPQGAWALEQMMDRLAAAIGMDPVALRLANVPAVSQGRGNLPYSSDGLRQCLERGAEAFGWEAARNRPPTDGPIRRGVGMAAGLWIAGAGGPPSTVVVKLYADGSANLNMGASDIGTGTKTVMAQVVAEELGVPMERISVENADTGTTQYATPSGGSKTVPTESPAVRDAALNVARQLLEMAADQLGVEVSTLELREGVVRRRDDPSVALAVTGIEGLQRRGLVLGTGYRAPNRRDVAITPFAAQFCEVEVDTRTGEVRVLRFLAAHDSGRVLNPKTFDNQVFGGIAMGIGFAMTERRVLDRRQTGKLLNRNFHDYKLPTMMDMPAEASSLRLDLPDDAANSTGAKGLGEPVTIPTAPAIANAVFDACGVRITDTYLNPTQLAARLAAPAEEA